MRIVNRNLLYLEGFFSTSRRRRVTRYLGRGVQEQTTYWSENDSHCEKYRKDCFGSENGRVGQQALLTESRIGRFARLWFLVDSAVTSILTAVASVLPSIPKHLRSPNSTIGTQCSR